MSRYGFLRQPRWLALGFLVLIVVPAFFLLARWQLNRLDERRHVNAVVEANSNAPAVPVDEVMAASGPASSVGDGEVWRPVTATGRYDVAAERLVYKRPKDGANGYWVMTPLVTTDGRVLVVNRGWLEATGSATEVPAVPPAPAGEVRVEGRVRVSGEARRPQPSDLPAGLVTDPDVGLITEGVPGEAYPGYVDLVSSDPAQAEGLLPLEPPQLSEGPHLSYAFQWVLFAGVAVVGFVLLVRRERDYADEDTRSDVA